MKTAKSAMDLTRAAGLLLAWLAWGVAGAAGQDAPEADKQRPYLGVYVESVPAVLSAQLGLDPDVGVVVEHVVEGSPAESAGLQVHDVLLRYDDQLLIGTKQIVVLVRNSAIGSEHAVTLLRGGEEQVATVTIGAAKGSTKADRKGQGLRIPAPPMAPEAPMPPHAAAAQRRAVDALARAREDLESGRAQVLRSAEEVDFEGRMELNEEIQMILERVTEATSEMEEATLPTFVFRGEERVFEFSDESGKRYVIVDSEGERELTILDASGGELYAGELNEAAKERLPERVRERLPQLQRIARVEAPVWVQESDREGL